MNMVSAALCHVPRPATPSTGSLHSRLDRNRSLTAQPAWTGWNAESQQVVVRTESERVSGFLGS